ncbi:MAG TPA: DUF488 family protein [Candidatus Diapherotrites archaeon]|uniref:DUF488 family protein n=1 Tax=Candidatus Iainarchaeum sp. TaxID=3101447 RepID=A0A7J4JKP7_9ARCH|nr:DUF488 family protein [Candidatus Diapherotrites archaeon]HIH15836.1 DUF488 family protein [Candidatus Diapherotrites archaeon]
MFRVKRVYEAPAKEDGCRVLVDRLWPRGLTKEKASIDEWLKEIAPSDALRKWFAHDPAKWPAFRKKYAAELRQNKEWAGKLKMLEKRHKVVMLLFGAKDIARNNAVALKEFLG